MNIIITLLVFVLYGNSINNEYSLDDNIVVDGNELVSEGFKSIPEIFKSRYAVDSKQQYDYRPIVSVTFAIEKQFFKDIGGEACVKRTIRNSNFEASSHPMKLTRPW